jgi:hypothetical protein
METREQMAGGLPLDADWMLTEAPPTPFDWVREGTSYWIFDESGAFAIPRIGVEAEPHTWDNRRYHANFAFPDGRVLYGAGRGLMPPVLDASGRPAVMGGGPLTFRCIEPFHKWHVSFDGVVQETTVADQIANTVAEGRSVPLKYEFEAVMTVPADVQDVNPKAFFSWPKGKQRDAASVGLGWRFQQLLSVEGELEVDGGKRSFKGVGNRVKRRSVRTDGLFLRGHCWQTAAFPDGRAFGFEVRPVHPEGFEPWNEAFVYLDGKMHHGKVVKVPWLGEIIPQGEDVSVEIETDLGITRIEGRTAISTFRIGNKDIWGLNLYQGGALYTWDGQTAYGMVERSTATS